MDNDEAAPHRPRWLGWVIALVAVLTALGVLYIGWKIWHGPIAP